MTPLVRSLIAAAGLLVVAWLLAHLFFRVQLPARDPGRGAFPDPLSAQVSLRQAFASLPAEGCQQTPVQIMDRNARAWAERWRLLAGARRRLDISYFILKQDIFGMAFLGHLVHKAREGVRIRVLLDAMGTKMSRSVSGNGFLDTLVRTRNVSVRVYRPLSNRYLDAFLTLNPVAIIASDHDKLLLADGRQALIGGRNISREYFTPVPDNPRAFRDLDALIAGGRLGQALERAFEAQYDSGEARSVRQEGRDLDESTDELLLAYRVMDAWLHARPVPQSVRKGLRQRHLPWLRDLQAMPQLRGALTESAEAALPADVCILDSRTRLAKADDPITRSLVRLIRSAREEIFIQSPYLVLLKDATDVLAEAAGRGVRITILTNGPNSSDNAWSQAFFLEQWPRLLERIPSLKLYVAADRHNLHGKFAVIDQSLSLVGTYNVDPLSMAINSELVAAAWSRPLARRILMVPQQMIASGLPAVKEYRLARDSHGKPLHDRHGNPVIAVGPGEQPQSRNWSTIQRYRVWVRILESFSRVTPLF